MHSVEHQDLSDVDACVILQFLNYQEKFTLNSLSDVDFHIYFYT